MFKKSFRLIFILSVFIISFMEQLHAAEATFQCRAMGISSDAKPILIEVNTLSDKPAEINIKNPTQEYHISFGGRDLTPTSQDLKRAKKPTGSAVYYDISRKVNPSEKLKYEIEGAAKGTLSDLDYVWVSGIAELSCKKITEKKK